MKCIGLLGGMSWVSTAEYYRQINQRIGRRLGGLHSAPLLIHSFNLAAIKALQDAEAWDAIAERMVQAARGLVAAGAKALAIACNTQHKVAPQIANAVDVPLVHIVDATADRIRARGMRRVGLLGGPHTMEAGYFSERLATHAVESLAPQADDRALVTRIIFDELAQNQVRPESGVAMRGVIDRLCRAGAEGVVLGCTELGLLPFDESGGPPLFDTTEIHVEAIVEHMLEGPE